MNKTISLKTKKNLCKVIIGNRSFKSLKNIINKNKKNFNIIVIDHNVYKIHKNYINYNLTNTNSKKIIFNCSERKKSIAGFILLTKKIFELKPDRKTKIIIIGGGVLGDLGGYVASSIYRGLELIIVPTTLLSQSDSSIGGKNGINNVYGKNLIGSFHQPSLVIVDTYFLKSLSKREIVSGYAEILKHSLIKDKNFYIWLNKNLEKIFKLSNNEVITAIYKSIKIKCNIVKIDENENLVSKNSRALLNFGHTFGHALEAKNMYKSNLKHGEAILYGIIFATKLSKKLELISDFKEKEIINHIFRIIKSHDHKKFKAKDLMSYIIRDKKNDKNYIKFILLKDIGKAFVSKNYNIKKVRSLLHSIDNDI